MAAERDLHQAATRERVVVFDGGMGATLEQFDLTRRTTAGSQGKCHEALVLNRPDVIQGVHESMLEAGAEVVETDTFQASRLKLEEWGLGEHTLEINTKAAEIARKAAGEDRFVAGSIGPTGHLPASDDPTLGKITFRELVEVFTEQAEGLIEGGADLIIIETAQDILEVKAAVFGAREAFKVTGTHAADPDAASRCCRNGGKMLLGTDIQAVLTTLDRARRRRDRAQLLDRPRGHARRDPLPRRELARCRCTASPTRACRSRAPTARRSSPRSPSRWPTRCRSSSSATASSIVGGCCGTTPEHIRAIVERVGGREAGPRPEHAARRRSPR